VSRTRDARRLADLLSQRAGVAVSVTWDQPSSTSRGRRWCWCVEWQDGPTIEQVKAWAQDMGALDVEALSLYRHLSARAWAVNLVRHVSAGGSFENRYGARYEVLDRMMAMPSPDVAADDREAARAEALLRLARHPIVVHGRTVLDGPDDEDPMIDVLVAHGLAALDGKGELPAGVTPIRQPKRAEESL
jgi:hypothetical protein